LRRSIIPSCPEPVTGERAAEDPDDLLGVHITSLTYTSPDNLVSQTNAILGPCRNMIEQLGPKPPFRIRGQWSFNNKTHKFKFVISPLNISEHRERSASNGFSW
jgi:hypothetical protein